MNVAVICEFKNWPMDRKVLSYYYINIRHFISAIRMWVNRSRDVREENVLVTSVSVTDMAPFTAGWML